MLFLLRFVKLNQIRFNNNRNYYFPYLIVCYLKMKSIMLSKVLKTLPIKEFSKTFSYASIFSCFNIPYSPHSLDWLILKYNPLQEYKHYVFGSKFYFDVVSSLRPFHNLIVCLRIYLQYNKGESHRTKTSIIPFEVVQ